MSPTQFLQKAETIFINNTNATNAQAMSKYMRHLFPFFGIKKPQRVTLTKETINLFSKTANENDILKTAKALWNKKEREFHYLAMDLLHKNKKKLTISSFKTIEWMLLQNQWWESVDGLSSNAISPLVEKFPELKSEMKRFSEHKNFWLQRVAIIHQLPYKHNTDQAFLFGVCLKHAGQSEFFIRKAIGWALRQYARTTPKEVDLFIKTHRGRLSPLSIREASKYL